MRTFKITLIAAVVFFFAFVIGAHREVSASCLQYFRYRVDTSTSESCYLTPGCNPWFCSTQGKCPGTGCGSSTPCYGIVRPAQDVFSCTSDVQQSGGFGGAPYCPCDAADQQQLAQMGDDTLVPGMDGCSSQSCQTSTPVPEQCVSTRPGTLLPVNAGCGDDEHKCSKTSDEDGSPLRFSSGRVESNPFTLFSLPTPDGRFFFGYRIQWGSHVMRTAAQARLVNSVDELIPTMHNQEETTHYFGRGWLDDYGDRLFINVENQQTTRIVWQARNSTVTFTGPTTWKSWSNKYELIDRGANPADGFGRWVVRTTNPREPRQIWSFEEYKYASYAGIAIIASPNGATEVGTTATFTTTTAHGLSVGASVGISGVGVLGYNGTWTVASVPTTTTFTATIATSGLGASGGGTAAAAYTLGRLKRHALLTSTLTDLTGKYGFTLTWASDGTLTKAVDSLSREIDFLYYSSPLDYTGVPPVGHTRMKRLQFVQYKPAPAAAPSNVVELQMTSDELYLDRVKQSGTLGYTRFLYLPMHPVAPATCVHCGSLMSDVIIPGDSAQSSPAERLPITSTEIGLEHNDYTFFNNIMIGSHTKYPGREYNYAVVGNTTTQTDLHPISTTCASCGAGTVCQNNQCLAVDVMTNDQDPTTFTRLPLTHQPSGVSGVSGDARAFTRTYNLTGAVAGSLKTTIDAAQIKTTYGFDSLARIRCIVHNDNNDEAFVTPASPDTSACDGLSSSQIIRVDYNGPCTDGYANCTLKTTTSLLSGNVVEEEDFDPTSLLSVRTKRTGNTHDINGSLVAQIQIRTRTYDSSGRLTEDNGPLTDSVALDKTTTTYYTTYDASWPNNLGHVYQVIQYVGTSGSNVQLITKYEQYDVFGVPHKVTGPNGDFVTYSTTDRLTWTIVQKGSDGTTTIGTSTVVLNRNGKVHSSTDADGICMTYEYLDSAGTYVGAPTKIRRSASTDGCGAAINENSGEVEVRTYLYGEADRPATIQRKRNGTVEFSYPDGSQAGLTYDRDRRVTNATTLDSTNSYQLAYTDVLQTGVTAPGAPAAGTWKTTTTADAYARPASLLRWLDGTNKQTYSFTYASTLSPRPTQLTRGYNGASTSTTTFLYDDFGRLIETTVPEAGTPGTPAATRYEYDVGGRAIKKRFGVGTSLVRTDVYTFDSLGRTTYVDHDTEHPVNCSTAPSGTAIEDEEYKYDNCTGDVPSGFSCTNALGKVTISRIVLQCGSGNQTVKRGRWYNYDLAGREYQVAYATVTGGTIGTPAIMNYSYTAAGRVSQFQSPINSTYGTQYTRSTADGRITDVQTIGASSIASNISYRAFGPLTNLYTPVIQDAGGGNTRKLISRPLYRSDNSLNKLRWSLNRQHGSGNAASIRLLYQTFGYTTASLVTTRNDAADPVSSRYYGYDALLRMNCEARGDANQQPSSSDCSGSSRLAGSFTYGNGESATSPPDVRNTAFLRADDSSYVSPSTETMTYLSGSSQVQSISRSGTNLNIAHDALGRRRYDFDSFDSTRSRRDYTYLPNGQLGTVAGQMASSPYTPYTASVLYDERGRPITITDYDYYELFWDDADRLIAVQITFQNRCSGGCPGGTPNYGSARWHYHYLGGQLVAATRELIAGGQTDMKRFWAVTDERGLVYRMVDSVGATYWQARWDASGWRTWVGTPQPEMWVPFGLPGQILLAQNVITTGIAGPIVWGTEAYASGGPGTWTRPPIALNRWRAYDPLFGAFLQPDGRDHTGRLMPEGFVYGRSSLLQYTDATGAESSSRNSEIQNALGLPRNPYNLDRNCGAYQSAIDGAIVVAFALIATCTGKGCSTIDNFRREILATLSTSLYNCPTGDLTTSRGDFSVNPDDDPRNSMDGVPHRYSRFFGGNTQPGGNQAMSGDGPLDLWEIYLSPEATHQKRMPCLAHLIAHEAIHSVLDSAALWGEEDLIEDETRKCFHDSCAYP